MGSGEMKGLDEGSMEKAQASDLEEASWSVVSFERVEAAGLTYGEAYELMSKLDAEKVSGLCLITDAAAARIRN